MFRKASSILIFYMAYLIYRNYCMNFVFIYEEILDFCLTTFKTYKHLNVLFISLNF